MLVFRGFGLALFCVVYLLIRLGSWAVLDRQMHLGRDMRYALYALAWGAVALSGFSISGFFAFGRYGREERLLIPHCSTRSGGDSLLHLRPAPGVFDASFSLDASQVAHCSDALLSKIRKAPKGTEEDGKAEGNDTQEEDVVVEWEEAEEKNEETEEATGSNISVEVEEAEHEPTVIEPSVEEEGGR